jgi:hypothetical protein
MSYQAIQYEVHIDIGGVAGIVAPIVGKQPPDSRVWTARAEVPILVKSDGPVLEGGPIWPLELASPVWPKGGSEESKEGR